MVRGLCVPANGDAAVLCPRCDDTLPRQQKCSIELAELVMLGLGREQTPKRMAGGSDLALPGAFFFAFVPADAADVGVQDLASTSAARR